MPRERLPESTGTLSVVLCHRPAAAARQVREPPAQASPPVGCGQLSSELGGRLRCLATTRKASSLPTHDYGVLSTHAVSFTVLGDDFPPVRDEGGEPSLDVRPTTHTDLAEPEHLRLVRGCSRSLGISGPRGAFGRISRFGNVTPPPARSLFRRCHPALTSSTEDPHGTRAYFCRSDSESVACSLRTPWAVMWSASAISCHVAFSLRASAMIRGRCCHSLPRRFRRDSAVPIPPRVSELPPMTSVLARQRQTTHRGDAVAGGTCAGGNSVAPT